MMAVIVLWMGAGVRVGGDGVHVWRRLLRTSVHEGRRMAILNVWRGRDRRKSFVQDTFKFSTTSDEPPKGCQLDSRLLEFHSLDAPLGLQDFEMQFIIILDVAVRKVCGFKHDKQSAHSFYLFYFSLEFFVFCLVLDVLCACCDPCRVRFRLLTDRHGLRCLLKHGDDVVRGARGRVARHGHETQRRTRSMATEGDGLDGVSR